MGDPDGNGESQAGLARRGAGAGRGAEPLDNRGRKAPQLGRTKMTDIALEINGEFRPWLAKINGPCKQYGFKMAILVGVNDYSQSKKGHIRFRVEDGIYLINATETGGRIRRYFLRVADGEIDEIKYREALVEVS